MTVDLPTLFQFAQATGVLIVAVLIWPIVRVIRERYLAYWAWGWVLLAGGLAGLFLSFRLPAAAVPLRVLYCVGGCGFGFLVWAGSRHYATARGVRPTDLWWLVPAVAFGVLGPVVMGSIPDLFGWHSAVLTAYFLAALWQTRRFHSRPQSVAGRRVYQGAVFALALLFAHYAAVVACTRLLNAPREWFPYMPYSSAFDLAVLVVLALGMVSIATERMRAELEEKNRRLRVAAGELEQAARTDPLTGLLNRRGLTELLARTDGLPAGCAASLDLNDLKPLNDRHGHDAGDVALRLVGRALRNLFRVTDPIFRLGGDEFLVLVPGATAEEMTRRMESLDVSLAGQRLPGVEGLTNLTVSWGVAAYRAAADLPAAVKAADEAMYQQKRQRKTPSDR